METRQAFSFLIILGKSVKLIKKNCKFMATITVFSVVPPSILFLLFSYFIQSLIGDMTASSTTDSDPDINFTVYLVILLAVEIVFLLAFAAITLITNTATILVSAASYSTGKNLSLQGVFPRIKNIWRKQLRANSYITRRSIPYLFLIAASTAFIQLYPTFTTISIGILLGLSGFVYYLYLSVVWGLASVVLVVEDSSSGKEAVERAAVLVEGQRLGGFFLNVFFNLLFLVVLMGYWIIMGYEGFMNLTIFGLFLLNFSSLLKIIILPAYTVFYFQCKKHHGEETESLGDFQYTELPTTPLATDNP